MTAARVIFGRQFWPLCSELNKADLMSSLKYWALISSLCLTSVSHAQRFKSDDEISIANPQRCDKVCIEAQIRRFSKVYKDQSIREVYEDCIPGCVQESQDALASPTTVQGICSDKCIRGLFGPLVGGAPHNPLVRPSGNNRAFILAEPMLYEVGSTGKIITVPAGFVTDYASIPESLWSLYSPHDQYSRAAIVHDYLYWSQLCTRTQADNLFMIAMKESEVPEVTRRNVYLAVATWGYLAWDANRAERNAGLPKVVPVAQRDFPPNWSWELYRKKLVSAGVHDPVFKDNSYCALGETTDVPNSGTDTSVKRRVNDSPKLVMRELR
jgi:hypothetical protein